MLPGALLALLATVGLQLERGTVPTAPPFAFLRRTTGEGAGRAMRVVVALWPDGQIIRSKEPEAPRGEYEAGRLSPDTLEHVVCELEAIDLWNYETGGPLILEPAEDLWLWRGEARKGWLRAIGAPEWNFPEFHEVRAVMLQASYSDGSAIEWSGIAPHEWIGSTGQSVATPRCKQLVDPGTILGCPA